MEFNILGEDEELTEDTMVYKPTSTKEIAQTKPIRENDQTKKNKKQKNEISRVNEINPEWRLKLHNLIKTNQLQLKDCKIFDYFESYHVIPKQSSSKSSTTFTTYLHEIDGNKLFVTKIWWKESAETNSLEYEAAVYEVIINYLIKNNFTPHVVSYLALAECSFNDFSRVFGKSLYDLKMYRQVLNQKEYNQNTLKILMTENVQKSNPLSTLIKDELFRNEYSIKLMSICFQIIYTYECFNRVGLRHNDGHLGNILVTDYSHVQDFPEFTLYELNNDTYAKVPTNYFVRIIDFDLASLNCDKTKIHPFYNTLIDQFKTKIKDCGNSGLTVKLCSQFGLCNGIEHKKYDTYQTFWLIKQEILERNSKHPIIAWMNEIFDYFTVDFYDEKTSHVKNVGVNRWLKKEYDSSKLMFPIEILLKKFPQFVKPKKSEQFEIDKKKYPVFSLPLSVSEQPYTNYHVPSLKDRFVPERQKRIIDANISISEDDDSEDEPNNYKNNVHGIFGQDVYFQ